MILPNFFCCCLKNSDFALGTITPGSKHIYMFLLNDCEVYKKDKFMNKLRIVFKNCLRKKIQNFRKKLSIPMQISIPKSLSILLILDSD